MEPKKSNPTPPHPVDALIAEHNLALALSTRSESTRDGHDKRRIAEEAFVAIEVHARTEEEIFDPAIRRRAESEEVRKMLDESLEEHHVASVLIQELKAMSTTDHRYDAKLKVMREAVEHHSKEQAKNLFPHARTLLGADAEALGAKMAERKAELMPKAA